MKNSFLHSFGGANWKQES